MREWVLNAIKRDKEKMETGKRPQPEEKKPSTDARLVEQMVKDIAGLGRGHREAMSEEKEVCNGITWRHSSRRHSM